MKQIFEFNNYKSYLKSLVLCSNKSKNEIYSELSTILGISRGRVGRLIEGNKHFSKEMLSMTCIYFGIDDLETQFLMVLFQLNQAVSWQEIDILCGELDGLKHEIISLKVEQTTQSILNPEIANCA